MARDTNDLGERTFHLRRDAQDTGWQPVRVRALQYDNRVKVVAYGLPREDVDRLRSANREVPELFEMLELEEFLTEHMDAEAGYIPSRGLSEGRVGAPVLKGVRAFHAVMRAKADAFAKDMVSTLQASLGPGIDLKDGWNADLAASIREEMKGSIMASVTRDVIVAWADRRLQKLLPILDAEEPYVAAPPGRTWWHVGSEVLASMRQFGLTVTEVAPRKEHRHYDTATVRISSVAGSRDIAEDCRKSDPSAAVRWAYSIHFRHSAPVPDLDQAKENIRRANARFEWEMTEDEVREHAKAYLAERAEQRAWLVGMIGEEGLAALIAVLPADPGEDAEGPSAPGER